MCTKKVLKVKFKVVFTLIFKKPKGLIFKMIFTADASQNIKSGSVECNLVLLLAFKGVSNIGIDIIRYNESNIYINII